MRQFGFNQISKLFTRQARNLGYCLFGIGDLNCRQLRCIALACNVVCWIIRARWQWRVLRRVVCGGLRVLQLIP